MSWFVILLLLAVAAGIWYRAHRAAVASRTAAAPTGATDDDLVYGLIESYDKVSREAERQRAGAGFAPAPSAATPGSAGGPVQRAGTPSAAPGGRPQAAPRADIPGTRRPTPPPAGRIS
jgi:hypothetical protein